MIRESSLFGGQSAVLSDCHTYRYRLDRTWGDAPGGVFVMLNPSTADHREDDPTIRRCIGFAKRWGWGRLAVVNLFALRATDPRSLRSHPDPVGGVENDRAIHEAICDTKREVVCAWGTGGPAGLRGRDAFVMGLIHANATPMRIGPPTKAGHPRHPLYLPYALELEPHALAGGAS